MKGTDDEHPDSNYLLIVFTSMLVMYHLPLDPLGVKEAARYPVGGTLHLLLLLLLLSSSFFFFLLSPLSPSSSSSPSSFFFFFSFFFLLPLLHLSTVTTSPNNTPYLP